MKIFKQIVFGLLLILSVALSGYSIYLHYYDNPFKEIKNYVAIPYSVDEFFMQAHNHFIETDKGYQFSVFGYLFKHKEGVAFLVANSDRANYKSPLLMDRKFKIWYPVEKMDKSCFSKPVRITGVFFYYSGVPNLDEIIEIRNLETDKGCIPETGPVSFNLMCYSLSDEERNRSDIKSFCKNRRVEPIYYKTHHKE